MVQQLTESPSRKHSNALIQHPLRFCMSCVAKREYWGSQPLPLVLILRESMISTSCRGHIPRFYKCSGPVLIWCLIIQRCMGCRCIPLPLPKMVLEPRDLIISFQGRCIPLVVLPTIITRTVQALTLTRCSPIWLLRIGALLNVSSRLGRAPMCL